LLILSALTIPWLMRRAGTAESFGKRAMFIHGPACLS
jgi:hypothetical protein